MFARVNRVRSVGFLGLRVGLLVGLGACIDTPRLAEPVIESSRVDIREVPEGRPPPLDVLIVVDDTPAMAPYRDRVATMPPMLARTLRSFVAGWADLRIAVASNDGRLRRLPGIDDPFLVDAYELDYTHHTNYAGTLEDALATLMDVGASNEGPSQPLEAIRRSLETSSQFLREPSAFALVVITASDDASPLPVIDYIEWMERVTEGRWWRPFSAAFIYNAPAPRLDTYYATVRTPLADGDYERAFRAIGRTWGGWGTPCLEFEPLDRDPLTPEVEPACTLSVMLAGEQRPVPECGATAPVIDRSDVASPPAGPAPACWSIRSDPFNCTWSKHHDTLRLNGYTDFIHPAYRFECQAK